jgi:hypothetical protein
MPVWKLKVIVAWSVFSALTDWFTTDLFSNWLRTSLITKSSTCVTLVGVVLSWVRWWSFMVSAKRTSSTPDVNSGNFQFILGKLKSPHIRMFEYSEQHFARKRLNVSITIRCAHFVVVCSNNRLNSWRWSSIWVQRQLALDHHHTLILGRTRISPTYLLKELHPREISDLSCKVYSYPKGEFPNFRKFWIISKDIYNML